MRQNILPERVAISIRWQVYSGGQAGGPRKIHCPPALLAIASHLLPLLQTQEGNSKLPVVFTLPSGAGLTFLMHGLHVHLTINFHGWLGAVLRMQHFASIKGNLWPRGRGHRFTLTTSPRCFSDLHLQAPSLSPREPNHQPSIFLEGN